ncbi:MAG: flagellar hook-length control protein FliK, partial [Mariprofundales bacterium]|nr:flagellar hook-length control protein FliK [Mariprofundales bacterium]
QATADQATIGQTTARQATADQATIGQTTARQATTGQVATAGQVAAEHATSRQSVTGHTTTGAGATQQTTTVAGQVVTSDAVADVVDERLQHVTLSTTQTKAGVVTTAKLTDDTGVQDDGVAAAMTLKSVAPVSAALHGTNSAELSSIKAAQQALANAEGRQHSGSGDGDSKNGNRSPQGALDNLLTGQRTDQGSAVRGAEFATQLRYRSLPTWRPADAMLQIGKAAADGSMRLDLQLEPVHLGKITVSIQSDAAKQVQLHITVDSAAGRVALDQNMGQLRAALAQQGLDLGSFSMNLSSQGRQEQGDRSAFSQRAQQQGASRIESDSVLVEDHSINLGINRAGAGRLSVLA